jgi:hypothetical protein
MIDYMINVREVLAKLDDRAKTLLLSMQKGMREGMRQFESYIVKNQLSGRKSPNFGLNRVSGNAASRWAIEEKGEGVDYTVSLSSPAWYLQTHQHHKFNGWIYPRTKKYLSFKVGKQYRRASKVYIPKRLFIYESFADVGDTIIKARMNLYIRSVLSK